MANNIHQASLPSKLELSPFILLTQATAILATSLRKYKTTASKVPTCKATSSAMPWSFHPKIAEGNIKCAELDTGKNSVKPCTMAKINISVMVISRYIPF